MPTDVAAFRQHLLAERAAVAAELEAIDVAAEEVLFNDAFAILEQTQRTFDRKRARWDVVQEKINRLTVLDAQIDLLMP